MCSLSIIFNEILIHMYDPLSENTEEEMQECLQTQGVALQQWHEQLGDPLKMTPVVLPLVSPPSHIVTLKYVRYANGYQDLANIMIAYSTTPLQYYSTGQCYPSAPGRKKENHHRSIRT